MEGGWGGVWNTVYNHFSSLLLGIAGCGPCGAWAFRA